MAVEPKDKQHPDIQKLNLNVKKLEEVAAEALSAFFADKENSANVKKRPYLNEIFKLGANRRTDGTTKVYVVASDKIPETCSENDDGSATKDDGDRDISATRLSTAQSLTQQTPDYSLGTAPHGLPSFSSDFLVQRTQPTPQITPEITTNPHGFVESTGTQTSVHPRGGDLTLVDNGTATNQNSSRLPPILGPQEGCSGQIGTNLYTQQWPPSSTAPNTSTRDSFAQQQTNPSATTYANTGVPVNQSDLYGRPN
ncbi:hypothetical protein AUP68_16933 [Ilyonectria robusta]